MSILCVFIPGIHVSYRENFFFLQGISLDSSSHWIILCVTSRSRKSTKSEFLWRIGFQLKSKSTLIKRMFLFYMLPYSIVQQYKLAQFKQYHAYVERVVCFCRTLYHQILCTRQEENGRICKWLCLCSSSWLMQWCSIAAAVMHLYSWIVIHIFYVCAELAVTGKMVLTAGFLVLCQNLEVKLLLNK